MGLNFPNAPTTNQLYPQPPVAGVPVYRWDGQKWITQGATPTKTPVYTDGSTPMIAALTLVAPPVNPTDAAAKSYVDTCLKLAGNQTTTGGFAVTPNNLGNIPASFTPNPMLGNYQYGTNSAAFTFNAPTMDCALDILITNSASAGAVTFSGFTANSGNVGDPLTTTNGNMFIISVRRINGISTYTIKALQ